MINAGARSLSLAFALLLASASFSIASAEPAVGPKAPGQSFGLAVSALHFALYQTPDKKECPEGLNATQRQNYQKVFPDNTARAANEIQFGYGYGNRGPHGENVLYSPELATDPIPFKFAVGPTGLGINLDGKVGPNDFVSPDGRTGIKNQLFRILGCADGFRGPEGYFHYIANKSVHDRPINRIMFEVSGVTDMKNDPHVIVRSYRGLDPIVDGAAGPTAGYTQHIDYVRGRRYMSETTGRIVDGVLMTDPVDMRVPWTRAAQSAFTAEFTIRGMQLRVKLTPTGGEGYIGGYADIPTWWNWFAKDWAQGPTIEVQGLSPPSMYRAILQLADGYPDEHGVNTAISMALSTNFVRVIVDHGGQPRPPARIASAGNRETAQ